MSEQSKLDRLYNRALAAGTMASDARAKRAAKSLGRDPVPTDLGPGVYTRTMVHGITTRGTADDPGARVSIGSAPRTVYETRTGPIPAELLASRLVGCERCGRYHGPRVRIVDGYPTVVDTGAERCERIALERDRIKDRAKGEIQAGGYAIGVSSVPHSEPIPCVMCEGAGCGTDRASCGSPCPNPDYCLCHCHGTDLADNPDAGVRCAACAGASGWTHRRVIPAGIVRDWADGSLPAIPARDGGMVALALAARAKREVREARDLAIGQTRGQGDRDGVGRSAAGRARQKARKAAKGHGY
jgi:hypothetical protein